MHADPKKVGLVGGVMLGGLHVLWSLLVLLGWAQPLVEFSMWAHMARSAIIIGPFDVAAATTVIIIASLIGYGVGYMVATVWNRVHRR